MLLHELEIVSRWEAIKTTRNRQRFLWWKKIRQNRPRPAQLQTGRSLALIYLLILDRLAEQDGARIIIFSEPENYTRMKSLPLLAESRHAMDTLWCKIQRDNLKLFLKIEDLCLLVKMVVKAHVCALN